MRWSVKIARVTGTEVRLHMALLSLLTWIGFTHYQAGCFEKTAMGLVLLLLLFLDVLLHELGHSATEPEVVAAQ